MEKVRLSDHTTRAIPPLPPRKKESHKGDYGRLLCVCGSAGMAGAAFLCAKAAYRCGAGLVEILTDKKNRAVLQTLIPEAIVSIYDTDALDLSRIENSIIRADAVVIGCGLGKSETASSILKLILTKKSAPAIIDADALNIISDSGELISLAGNNIITPHLMEMSRLCKKDVADISGNVAQTANDFARENNLICALKCHETAIADGSGDVYINKYGNSGMATAGSGDVLAGMIGGILAQNKHNALSLFDVAILGVHLHAKAGDAAAERLGEYSLMASDIIENIPRAVKELYL